jgi:hypothetical protein
MSHRETAPPAPHIDGWRAFGSDQGRLWACREKPFTAGEESAGAYRVVDADDLDALRAEIDVQERIAGRAESSGDER